MVNLRVGRGDEALEKRMRLVRLAVEFRVELARDEKRMVRQFDDFDEFAVGRVAAENEVGLGKTVSLGVVEFVAMTVAFVDNKSAV